MQSQPDLASLLLQGAGGTPSGDQHMAGLQPAPALDPQQAALIERFTQVYGHPPPPVVAGDVDAMKSWIARAPQIRAPMTSQS